MSEDLINEIEAINAIYDEQTLQQTYTGHYTLSLPSRPVTLRLFLPTDYPTSPPSIVGTESVGDEVKKGYGNHVLDQAREILNSIWQTGEVCLYNLIQELGVTLEKEDEEAEAAEAAEVARQEEATTDEKGEPHHPPNHPAEKAVLPYEQVLPALPTWTISNPITSKNSLFIAHATPLYHPSLYAPTLTSLLSGNNNNDSNTTAITTPASHRKLSTATHNITAYRIRIPNAKADTNTNTTTSSTPFTIFQDHDDDGEKAAGGRLLHLLQVMDAWNVLVVVSRWYGGTLLGPERFRIIGEVAREVLVKGGWGGKKGPGKQEGKEGEKKGKGVDRGG